MATATDHCVKNYQFLTIVGLLMGILAMTGQNSKPIMLYLLLVAMLCMVGGMIAFIANK